MVAEGCADVDRDEDEGKGKGKGEGEGEDEGGVKTDGERAGAGAGAGTSLGDSLDLVVVGAWRGRGKRTGLYGAFLLAAPDASSGRFQSVCRVGTGFSEEALVRLAAELGAGSPSRPAGLDAGAAVCDAWFEPAGAAVWEVRCADLSLSPVHACARGSPLLLAAAGAAAEGKGVALRFPRFLRARPDKRPGDATSADDVAEMFAAQRRGSRGAGAGATASVGASEGASREVGGAL